MGKRSLTILALSYLMTLASEPESKNQFGQAATELCLNQLKDLDNNNMTEKLAALSLINSSPYHVTEQNQYLDKFVKRWPSQSQRWFRLQAAAPLQTTLEKVKNLMGHELFNIKNPNYVYSLIGAFAGNLYCYHGDVESASGYEFYTDQIIKLSKFNPQVAARLMTVGFYDVAKLPNRERQLMNNSLTRIFNEKHLAREVYEITEKCLSFAAKTQVSGSSNGLLTQ